MKKFIILFALGISLAAGAATKTVPWFNESAAALDASKWTQSAPTVSSGHLVISAETGATFTPTALPAENAVVTLSNVCFMAEQTELPAIGTTKVGITLYNGHVCVISNGAWLETSAVADPEASYTIVCIFDYAANTMTYRIAESGQEEPLLSTETKPGTTKLASVSFVGDAELDSLVGAYELLASTPIEPGANAEIAAADAQAACEAVEIAVPAAVEAGGIDPVAYRALFTKQAVAAGDGKWTVSVEIAEGVSADVKTALTESSANVLEPDDEGKVEVKTTPGLYYSFRYGASLLLNEASEAELATGTTLKLVRPQVSGDKAFYRLKADATK